MLEKAVHHVNVRIDELEDKLKAGFSRRRTEDGGRTGGIGSRSGSFIGGDGGSDDGGGGGGYGGDGPGSGPINFSQFNNFMNTQNKQLGIVQQEVNEIKQAILEMMKMPPASLSIPSHLSHLPDNDSLKQPQMLGAAPTFSSMERSQTSPPGTEDQQLQQQYQQQQLQQPPISQGESVVETKQPSSWAKSIFGLKK